MLSHASLKTGVVFTNMLYNLAPVKIIPLSVLYPFSGV